MIKVSGISYNYVPTILLRKAENFFYVLEFFCLILSFYTNSFEFYQSVFLEFWVFLNVQFPILNYFQIP